MINSISEITKIWDKALARIEKQLNDSNLFNSFFEGSYIYEITGNTIVVVANSSLASVLMKQRYHDIIVEAVNDVTETSFNLEFIGPDDVKKDNSTPVVPQREKVKYFEHAKLNTKLTFDNFVVGSFNREASQASLLIASNPGKTFNPLFIHSNSGLGKTHLLHAVGNYIIKEGNPNAKILYITANDFVEEYIRYVRAEKDQDSLKDFFYGVDVLLFDDVQFLADKVKTEEMFFYVYQRMINEGKQIVITSDKQPSELRNLEERLVTRFSQGLVVKIEEPDQNTCVQILEKKIASNGLDPKNFEPAVLQFFADKFSKNVRELEGALNRLIFYTINLRETGVITLDVAIEAVQSLTGGKQVASQLNEYKVINVVSDYYGLTPSQLTGKIRTGQVALARHIAMYLIRTILDLPLKKIGETFGGRDHSTVMSGIDKVEKELKKDPQLGEVIALLSKRIKP